MFPNAKGYRPSAIEMMNVLYRLYTPPRCFTCCDSMAEFADISCGDPWMVPPEDIDFYDGYTFVLARNPKGDKLLRLAEQANKLGLVPLKKEVARTSNILMGSEKRERAWRMLSTRQRQGLPVPDYGFEIPKSSMKHRLKVEINLLTHCLCFISFGRTATLKFFLSPVGYVLFWLNNKKRNLRYFIKKRKQRTRERDSASSVSSKM